MIFLLVFKKSDVNLTLLIFVKSVFMLNKFMSFLGDFIYVY